jgi:protoheme ferro-lyase
LFKEHGGEKITLVRSLNDNDDWVKAFKEIVLN